MSTETAAPRPPSRRAPRALAGVAALLVAAGADAAEWRLLPSVDLSFYRDGNVFVTGGQGVSDDVARVGATLDWTVEDPGTSFRLTYAPYHESYSDRSSLDYTAHQLSVAVSRETSRRTSFRLDLSGWLAERQPVQTLAPDVPTTLLPRTEQLNLYLDLSGQVAAGRRSFLDWGGQGSLTSFRGSATAPQDSDTVGASVGWGIELDPATDLGARVRAQRLSFDTSPTTDTQAVELFFRHDSSRELSFSAQAGVVRSSSGPGSRDATDPKLGATVTRTFRRGTTLEGGVRQDVSNAAGVGTATLDRGAYLSVRPTDRTERFSTNVTFYYWRREAVDSTASGIDLETLEGVASLAWTPRAGFFAVGAFYSYHDQHDLSGIAGGIETSYGSGGVFFRWNFRGAKGVRS